MSKELTSTQKFLNRIERVVEKYGFVRVRSRFERDVPENSRPVHLHFVGSGRRAKNPILHPMITLGLRADRRRGPLPKTEPSFWLAELGARFGFEGAHFIGHYSSSSANERWYELFEEVLLHVLKDLDPILRDADLLRSLVDDAPVVTHLSASSARPKKQD